MLNIKKAAILIMSIAVVSVLALSGCQAKKQGDSSSGYSSSQMQNKIKSGLKSLVSDGTITQAQADKIQTVLSNMTQRRGQRNASGSNANRSENGSRPSLSEGSGSRPFFQNGSRPEFGSGASSGSQQQFSPLSSLVSDGTITQNQADTVMQRIFGSTGFGGNARGRNNSSQ